ncbi:MAG: hypothetical protein JWO58_2112 [Chitinophagaceae bacterium]|nr:hypothetical protein [Chitinophagaceae bacterium]
MGIIIKQSIKGTLWNYVGVLLGAINIMWVFPYFLTPEEIGIYRVVIDLGTLFAIFAGLGTANVSDRFYVKVQENFRSGFTGYVSLMACVGFVIFSALYFFFSDWFFNVFSKNAAVLQSYKWYVLILTFTAVLLSLYDSIYRIKFNIVLTVFFREVFLRLFVLVITIVVGIHLLSFEGMMDWVLFSYLFAIAFMGIWYYLKYIRTSSFTMYWPDKVMFHQINNYAMVILVGGGSAVLISRIDVFMIVAMMEDGLKDQVAVYTLGFFIASVIEVPRRAISQIATPLIANAWHHDDVAYSDDLYKRSAVNQLIIGGGIFLLIWIGIDDLLLMIPKYEVYKECKNVVLWVGIARMLNMITGLSGEIILQSKYYLFNIVSVVVLVILITIFNYIFIPLKGIEGAAIGTCLAILGYNALKVVFLKVKLNMTPFTWPILWVTAIGLVVYVPFVFWPVASGGIISNLFNIGLKSLVCGLICVPLLYWMKVSEDMNNVLNKAFQIATSLLGGKQR